MIITKKVLATQVFLFSKIKNELLKWSWSVKKIIYANIDYPSYQWVLSLSDFYCFDDRKEMLSAVVWSCLPFIRSGPNHLARHCDRGRRQGRQRKRWEDNIRELTGREFGRSQRALENREKWRKLVAKSSVLPQWPSQLRDWWWCKNKFVCPGQSCS